MARNVYAMSIWVREMKIPYRVLSEIAPELTFGPESELRHIEWVPVTEEDNTITPEFLGNLVTEGVVRRVRVYRAQVNRGSKEGAFAGRGGRPGSREPKQEEPWR